MTKILKDSVTTNGKIRLHHAVLAITPADLKGLVVDHINHNSLDDQKHNLEKITQELNMQRSNGWKKKTEEPCL